MKKIKQRHSLYMTWMTMRKRCTNPKAKNYDRYGGRGITVCKEWDDFTVFLLDMGERPPGTTLDRKDNDGPYCKSNCQWATLSQQNRNTVRARKLTLNGKTMNVTDWEIRLGLSQGAIWHRLKKLGWPLERALSSGRTA